MNYKFGVLLFVAHMCTALALPTCICNLILQPVCGSDGKTYNNRCSLDCERMEGRNDLTVVKPGNCDNDPILQPICICPEIYNPVCGSDGKTYSNVCLLDCEKSINPSLQLSHFGKCKENDPEQPLCKCTLEVKPVCGSDGNTYENVCFLTCATTVNPRLTLQHEGRCA